MFTIY